MVGDVDLRTLDVGYIDVIISQYGLTKTRYIIDAEWNEIMKNPFVQDAETGKGAEYDSVTGALNALYTWGWEVVLFREVDAPGVGKKRKWLLKRRH
jgi:hypothetical protein